MTELIIGYLSMIAECCVLTTTGAYGSNCGHGSVVSLA